MKRHIYEVVSVTVTSPYTLRVEFDDRTVQEVDLRAVLHGEMFGPLRDLALFNQVRIDPEIGAVVWPNGADMDPGVLHDWPEYAADMADMASRWSNGQNVAAPQVCVATLQVAEDRAPYGASTGRDEWDRLS